jgi:hypothetical protein
MDEGKRAAAKVLVEEQTSDHRPLVEVLRELWRQEWPLT